MQARSEESDVPLFAVGFDECRAEGAQPLILQFIVKRSFFTQRNSIPRKSTLKVQPGKNYSIQPVNDA